MADIVVHNQAELTAALKKVQGGETIKLASGSYGVIKLDNINPSGNVTIVSADLGNPAKVDQILVSSSSNFTFKGLDVGLPVGSPEPGTKMNSVTGSSKISFDDVHFSGTKTNPAESSASGLVVRDSADVSAANSTFDHVMAGVDFARTTGIIVKNNSFSQIRRDGMILSEVSDVLIDGNVITDLHPAGADHPDGIQFFTNGTKKASSNITISNNVIVQGAGAATQGIFLGDELGGALPYTNVNIVNNLVYMSGLSHGIYVAGGRGVVVSSNSVLSRSDDATPTWIMLRDVSGAAVSNNVADKMVSSNSVAVTVSGNSWLEQSGSTLRSLGNLNGMAQARISDLLVERLGFHPAAGTAAYDMWMAEKQGRTAASVTLAGGDHMVLDLQFGANGAVDHSRFNSQATPDAANIETANGKGVYHVATGEGFGLARQNSWQLYGMSAFTLSFSLQRDSATSTTGQVLGIYQSWSVSLQSSGELNFTMKNDAGVVYSVVTNGAKIKDTDAHDIAITYDKATKRAVIYVDNVARGSGTVTGSTRELESWGLYVGYQFGTSFAGKVGDIQMRDVALPASQIGAGAGSGPVAGDPGPVLGQNPFLAKPLVSAAVTSIADYQRYALEFAHA